MDILSTFLFQINLRSVSNLPTTISYLGPVELQSKLLPSHGVNSARRRYDGMESSCVSHSRRIIAVQVRSSRVTEQAWHVWQYYSSVILIIWSPWPQCATHKMRELFKWSQFLQLSFWLSCMYFALRFAAMNFPYVLWSYLRAQAFSATDHPNRSEL